MSTFTAVDLSRLPAPDLVDASDYETILAAMAADAKNVATMAGITLALGETDPAMIVLQVCAYRELVLRKRVNDAARQCMLAFATGSNLDHLAAGFGVQRLVVTPADPTTNTPAVMESDLDLRRRVQLAPEGYSVAGPQGAYIYHALSADGDVLDASVASPPPSDIRAVVAGVLSDNDASPDLVDAMNAALDAAVWPGDVRVTVLSRTGDGTASQALIDKVMAIVGPNGADDIRPLGDNVTVHGAEIVNFEVIATVRTFDGPDSSVVLANARARLEAYVADCHRLGRDITESSIKAALTAEGVMGVKLTTPIDDIVIDRTQAPWCTGITINNGGIDE